jgi:hypothetical protein
MNNLKQLFMVGVIALCAAGMTQAVAAAYGGPVVAGGVIITNDHNDGADPRGPGSDDSGSGAGGGSNTITFGNTPGGVGGGTMSNSVGTGTVTGGVVQEVTLTNPY